MKYNHIILAGDYDYNRILYSDLYGMEGVIYTDGVGKAGSALRLLHRVHTSPKLNRMLHDFPGKERWYPYYFRNPFTDDKPLCLCFHASYLLTRYRYADYLKYLRGKFPSVKLVLYYEDRVDSFDPSISPDAVRGFFDLLVSYDKAEAENYGISYFPTVASKVSVPPSSRITESEVYLLAFAKDRFPRYLAVYEYLTSNGICCDFNILGVPESQRVENGIHYLSKPMSYMCNLQHVQKTKCILDIQQYNSVGYTLRLWEAVLYDRKLISDNRMLSSGRFYDPRYVSLLCGNEPDLDFIRSGEAFENPFKREISPVRFIEYLEESL